MDNIEFRLINRDRTPIILTEFKFGEDREMSEESKQIELLNDKKIRLQKVLTALIETKGLCDESVLFISQELDKVIVELTKILNGVVSDDEYDMYLLFCDIYCLDAYPKDILSKNMMENQMLYTLMNSETREDI